MALTELPKNALVLALSVIISNLFWSPVFDILFKENIPFSYKLFIYTILHIVAITPWILGIGKLVNR